MCRRLRLGGRDEGLHEVVDVEGDALAVGAACGGGDEGAVLVGDTDEALGHLVVVDGLAGFGNEMVAQTGADEKLYVVAERRSRLGDRDEGGTPWLLHTAAKAKSARVKMAPPWQTSAPLIWLGPSVISALA